MRLSNSKFLSVLMALAPLAGTSTAATIDYVTTSSSIFSGSVVNNYDSLTGLSQNAGNCYLQGGGTGPCAMLSSNPSTNTPGLTSSSVVIANGVAFDPQNGISGYGAASASASLASGTVHAYASGPNCSVPNASGCDSGGNAKAQIQDSLTFSNTTGHTVDVAVDWSFDGTTLSLGTYPSITVQSLFCFASGTGCLGGGAGTGNPDAFSFLDQNGGVSNQMPTAGWVSTALSPGTNATSETFQGVFAIPAGMSTDSLTADIQLGCLISTCDFSNTGTFTLGTLPSGVTFTSASGVLLTSPVPEQGTFTLTLAAAVLIAVGRIRRKRQRVVASNNTSPVFYGLTPAPR